jgi:hypothetical protein
MQRSVNKVEALKSSKDGPAVLPDLLCYAAAHAGRPAQRRSSAPLPRSRGVSGTTAPTSRPAKICNCADSPWQMCR